MINALWRMWWRLLFNPALLAKALMERQYAPKVLLVLGLVVDSLLLSVLLLWLNLGMVLWLILLKLVFTVISTCVACMVLTKQVPSDYLPRFLFWFGLFQVVLSPPLLVVVGVGGMLGLSLVGSASGAQAVIFCLMLGYLVGIALSYYLLINQQRRGSVDVRWAVLGIAPATALGIWYSPAFANSLAIFFAPIILGLGVAQLRLVMWLGQVGLGWVLQRIGVRAQLLTWHPIQFDALRLLPLPGTTNLLHMAAQQQPTLASDWIVARSQHLVDRWLVIRFLQDYATNPNAHRLFFALSLTQAGAELLAASIAGRDCNLNQCYARLAAVQAPGAWLNELATSGLGLAATAPMQLDPGLKVLLPLAFELLLARRWADAALILQETRIPSTEVAWLKQLSELRSMWVDNAAPAIQPPELQHESEQIWPNRLMLTLADHVSFLKEAESLT